MNKSKKVSISKSKKKQKTKLIYKKKYHNYTTDNLQKALNAVTNGSSIRDAGKTFDVPFSTLRCKVKGIYPMDKKSGPSTVLTADEEQHLVDWILLMGTKGFPFTKNMLIDSVKILVQNLKRENPFKDNKPGRHWFESFMKRHPELSMRTAQNLCQRRADVTEELIRKWFSEVADHLQKKNLLDNDSSRIFNCDETSFMLNPKPHKVIVDKTSKSVHSVVGSDDKECVTVLMTGNAAGDTVPPMVMFAYKRLPQSVIEKIPNGWAVGRSENGWMTAESFFEFMTNIFYPWCVKSNIEFPVVMYLDGHSSHATLALSDFCVEKQIEIISLFPNSTHITQPMDVALFKPLKDSWKTSVMNYKLENGGVSLKKTDFALVLKMAIDQIDFKKIMSRGFACCGLSPFSPDAVNYSKLINKKNCLDNVHDSETEKEVKENVDYEAALKAIESSVDSGIIQRFKIAASRNREWHGEEKYSGLFDVWLKNTISLNTHSNANGSQSKNKSTVVEDTSKVVDADNNNDLLLSATVVSDDLCPSNNVIIEEIIVNNNVDVDNTLDLNNIIILRELDVISNIDNNDNFQYEQPITIAPAVSNENVENLKNEIPGLKSTDENIGDAKADIRKNVPAVFTQSLFWPQANIMPNKTIKNKKEKIPAVATSDEWRDYHKQKMNIKREAEEQKEIRKKIKLEKMQIKKEEEEKKIKIKEEKLRLKKEKAEEKLQLQKVKINKRKKTVY